MLKQIGKCLKAPMVGCVIQAFCEKIPENDPTIEPGELCQHLDAWEEPQFWSPTIKGHFGSLLVGEVMFDDIGL